MPAELDTITDLMRRVHGGDAWHGPSVLATLEGLGPEDAAARPIAGAHSIWELVLHVASWRGEVAARLGGKSPDLPDEGDWPAVPEVTAESWTAALDRLRASHEQLLAAVRRFDARRLASMVEDAREPALGTGVSFYVTLHGIVQHDAYHAGQIALLRKALGA